MAEGHHGWGGTLAIGPWWLLYTGVYGPTARHAHHAVQIISSTDDVVVAHGTGASLAAPTITIPSDLDHQITSAGLATMVFVDADSAVGRRLTAGSRTRPVAVDATMRVQRERAAEIVREVLELVNDPSGEPAPAVTPLVAEVLAELADDPGAGSAAGFADRFGLSPSRFSQRFTREVGLPLRSYRRWARMLHAVEALAEGASLTVAAHDAGFTDSAHLTHTFRDYFGLAPTDLLASTRFESLD